MSTKKKRKSRNTLSKKKPDLTFPISIDLIGTEQDPCFGKLFDPRASECQRCGDSELCAIAMGQRNHLLREKVESKQDFKDLEELEIPKVDGKVLRKSIRNRIRSQVKRAGNRPISIDLVIDDIFATYGKDGFSKVKIKKMIKKLVENSSYLTLTKNNLQWKK